MNVETWRTDPFTELRFVYDGWNLLVTLTPQLSPLNTFVWGLDLSGSPQGAGGVGGLLRVTYSGPQTTNTFAAYDGNGNVLALVDGGDGNVVARYENGPFGEAIRATGPMSKANPLRFSTKYQDDETELIYYGYRHFSDRMGRWLSRDPIEEKGGTDLYAFVSSDPINNRDTLGLLETRFTRNSRRITGHWTSGEWSQPDGFGDGTWYESDTTLEGWIHLWSGPAKNGICNSIDGTLPYPGPRPPGEPVQYSHHAGAFTLEARHDCRQKFRIYIGVFMAVVSKGPNGNATANMWIYGRTERGISVVGDDNKTLGFSTYIDVVLDRGWKAITYYYPTISFNASRSTPLRQSEGEAIGHVEFLGFD